MLTDWGVDTLGMSRGLKQEYFLLTDPLAIIAAALLIAKLTDLQRHRWTYPVGMALIVAHVAISQAEPVKHAFLRAAGRMCCAGFITTPSGSSTCRCVNHARVVSVGGVPRPAPDD